MRDPLVTYLDEVRYRKAHTLRFEVYLAAPAVPKRYAVHQFELDASGACVNPAKKVFDTLEEVARFEQEARQSAAARGFKWEYIDYASQGCRLQVSA